MIIKDPEVQNLDIAKAKDLAILLVKFLCGEKYPYDITENVESLLTSILSKQEGMKFSFSQINEILLLLNQDKITESFYNFFFTKNNISLEELRNGIIKFREFALLSYGNFLYAFRELNQKTSDEIVNALYPFSRNKEAIIQTYLNRSKRVFNISTVPQKNTYYLGETTYPSLESELVIIENYKEQKGRTISDEEVEEYEKTIINKIDDFEKYQEMGINNTEIYLTWANMDIYVATSMRDRWEFEETHGFIERVFSDPRINKLKLNYFDPTQSKCTNSRDKGLIEGLMLKRVNCTIYMAQETDTMGKDSELATSLARRTPVIAYVPKYSYTEYAKKIKDFPLEFYKKRLMTLRRDGIFTSKKYVAIFEKEDPKYRETIDNFLDAVLGKSANVDERLLFNYWEKKEEEYKKESAAFETITRLLAIAECLNFDRRAMILKLLHPLSIQIDLSTGLANGVFVARTEIECIELLLRILTNELEFNIKHTKLYNITLKEYELLSSLSNVVAQKLEHEYETGSLQVCRYLSQKDYLELEQLAKNEKCPKKVRKLLQHFHQEGATILEERISKSDYRVITDNDKLTNSFWNLYK